MLGKGSRMAVGRPLPGIPPVRTKFHFVIGRTLVARKMIAFAVLMALVLSMTGCKVLDIG